jgi:hypothetical protein
MLQAEHYRRLYTGGAKTYPEAVRVFDQAYGLGISSRAMETAKAGEHLMRRSFDKAHTNEHLLELVRNAELLLLRRWPLRENVDWSQLIEFISLHDTARSKIPVTPITLFSGQLLEDVLAPMVAHQFMRRHWHTVDENLLGIIARHPYHAGHPKRDGKDYSDTEKLAVDIDSLAVLSPTRVDRMYEHIKASFFGMSLVPFHGFLSRVFANHADFSFFYPETAEVAKTWRDESRRYIDRKFPPRGKGLMTEEA